MRWFWDTLAAEVEKAELRKRYPALSLQIDRERKQAVLSGVIMVAPDTGYSVSVEVPKDYPIGVPRLRCRSEEVPIENDRHFDQITGTACLCARTEYRVHWPSGSSLADFIDRLVLPFLAGQFYYDTHGTWPPTGQRSHGLPGIIEAYRELAMPFGNTSNVTLLRLAELLARTSEPKGHEMCPCGSQRRLRNCHQEELQTLRRTIEPRHVAQDLMEFRRAFPSPSDSR